VWRRGHSVGAVVGSRKVRNPSPQRGPEFAVESPMRILPKALILVIAVTLAACGALSPMAEKPDVTVRSVSLSAAGFTGMDGNVSMDVYNPNGFGMPLKRVEWTLSVGSAQAVRGSFELSETIPAKGSAPVEGRIHIGVGAAVGVAAAIAEGIRTYNIQATLTFQTRLGDLKANVSHQGELL